MASIVSEEGSTANRKPVSGIHKQGEAVSKCTEDAEFVNHVMKQDVNCVSENVERSEKSDLVDSGRECDPVDLVKCSGNGTDEKNIHMEKRKRESDSENNDESSNARKKSKGVRKKLKSQEKQKVLKQISDNQDSDISDIETETDSDIVIMLKALTILEKKMDKRFDEIKENNSDSIRQIKGEIDAVKSDFNSRMEGLTKKVETKVTDSVQKIVVEKLKIAQSDLKKSVSKTVSADLKQDIERTQEKMIGLERNMESLRDLVNDIKRNGDSSIQIHEGERVQNIVIRNLPETENENTLNKVNALIKDGLSLRDAACTRAVRKQSRRDSQPGVVIATCSDRDTKTDIMKAKSNLKRHRNYENVYIEHDRSRAERSQISSLRTLVQAVGKDKVRMRGNRVVYHNAESNEREFPAMDTDQRAQNDNHTRGYVNSERERRNSDREDGRSYRTRGTHYRDQNNTDRSREREQYFRHNRHEQRDQNRSGTRYHRRESDNDRHREQRRNTDTPRRDQTRRRQ